MQTSDTIDELAAALAKAQGAIGHASKDAANPAFKRDGKEMKYATLASVWDACRASLAANGIAVIQTPGTDETGAVTMTTTLAHSSGQWVRGEMACRPVNATAQSMGSVVTYLRRYSLSAMVGVAPDDDDDGNAASTQFSAARPAQQKQAPTPKKAEAKTPFDAPVSASMTDDLSIWLEQFRADLESAPSYLAGQEVWTAGKDTRAVIKREHPVVYADLENWTKGIMADKPRNAAE